MRRRLDELLERDPHLCVWCGQAPPGPLRGWTVEHLLPKSRGGSNRLANMALSCAPCNQARRSKPVSPYFQKLYQGQLDHPSLTPLFRALERLAREGSKEEQLYATKQLSQLRDWHEQRLRWGR